MPPARSPASAEAPAEGSAPADPFWFCGSAPGGLPETVRPGLEHAFGMDLGGVRIHADSGEASALGAHAFARGADIHFAPGRYDASGGDPHLLAHEVAHVAQQAEGRVATTAQAKGVDLNDTPALEDEADRMAADAVAGRVARTGPHLTPHSGGVVQGYFADEDGDEEPRWRVKAARQLLKAKAPGALAQFDRLADNSKRASQSIDEFLGDYGLDLDDSSSSSESSSGPSSDEEGHDFDGEDVDFDIESDGDGDSEAPLVNKTPAKAPAKKAPAKKAPAKKAPAKKAKFKPEKRNRSESGSGNDAPKKKQKKKSSSKKHSSASSSSQDSDAMVDGFLDEVATHFQAEQESSGGLQTAKYRSGLLANTSQPHRDLDRLAWVLEKLKSSRVCVAIGVEDHDYYLFANEPDAALDEHFQLVDAAALDEEALDKLVKLLVATPSGCRLKKTPENQAKRDAMEDKHKELVTRRAHKAARGLRLSGKAAKVKVPARRGREPIHAEQQGTDYAKRKSRSFDDMGISKLCCAKCWMALQAAEAEGTHDNLATGTHWKTYASDNGWPIPAHINEDDAELEAMVGKKAAEIMKKCPEKCAAALKEQALPGLKGAGTTDIVSSEEEWDEVEARAEEARKAKKAKKAKDAKKKFKPSKKSSKSAKPPKLTKKRKKKPARSESDSDGEGDDAASEGSDDF